MPPTSELSSALDAALWSDFRSERTFPSVRPLLAHYTSLDVLEKILRNNEMWLSNPLYMNDWEELQYGMELGAHDFRTSAHLLDAVGSADRHARLVAHFDKFFDDFDRNHALDTYVLCFCRHRPEDTDGLLSMWRGYGARGGGVALVIDTSKLGAIEQSPLVLADVHYASHAERLTWIDEKLARLADILRQHPQTDENLFYAAHYWIERLKLFSLFTKHDGFSEEQEWRVVYMSERDKNKALSGMLSYLITPRGVEPKLKLRLTAIPGVMDASVSIEHLTARIILGPTISTNLAANSVRRMVALQGTPALAERVVASSIPYRP